MSDPITVPPALVRGCNTPHGINVLSDWIEEQTGHTPKFNQEGWSDGFNHVDNGYSYGYINGDGKGDSLFGYLDGDGFGYGHYFYYGNGLGNGLGDGYHFNYSDGKGNGCGGGFEYKI